MSSEPSSRPAVRRLRAGAGRAWQLTQKAVPAFFADRCPQFGAGIAFFALFSVFPSAIVLTAAFGLIAADAEAQEEVVSFLVERLPLEETGAEDLRGALDAVAGEAGAVGAIGLAGVLYSASALMGAIRNSLNAVWKVEEGRPPLRAKALDVLLVFGLGFLFVLALAIALIESVAADLGREIGVPDILLEGTFSFVALAVPLLLAALVFALLLRFVPARHQAWRDIWPGVLVATAGYKLVQVGFTFYLDNFARYSAVYGSLGAVIAFMVFVYVAAMAFLLGAEYARLWPRVRAGEFDDEEGDDLPLGRRILDFLKGLAVDPDRRPPSR